MQIRIELTRNDLQRLVAQEIRRQTGVDDIDSKNIQIETRSTQNYKSEWESADFRAVYQRLVVE